MRHLGERSSNKEEQTEINVAPLLDMVFILLIFFVVTAVFVDETGIEVQRPSAATAAPLENESLLLALTAEGRIVYSGRSYSLNSIRALIQRELSARDLPVIVQVDEQAPSGRLVDVIDECKLGGAQRVSVAARKE
jgi:biopolymer transport protein ExbD